jgi:hypothetical protein
MITAAQATIGVHGPGSIGIPADLAMAVAVALATAIVAGFLVLKALRR